ncbi:MAG: FtsH protease activity modulator HflK [Lachnospiraceae bacterium]|nr:FtsH protease activity modulator HflK [Lachnospiraceae bacterium]
MSTKAVKAIKTSVIVVIAIIVISTIFGSAFTVSEQEAAVVTTFGKAKAVTESGLHLKIPFVQKVKKVDTTIRGFAIGYDKDTDESIDNESLMITKDYNFVNIDFYVEAKVSEPITYLYASEEPFVILKNLAQGCIRSVVSSYDVDSVITTSKSKIQAEIKDMIVEKLDKENIGIQLVNITIQDATPPTADVIKAFKEVENAKQSMDTAINNAEKYKNEKLLSAEAETDKIINKAEGQKATRIAEAEAAVAKFNAMYAEYVKNPDITENRMYYETLQEILPTMKVVINGGNGDVDTMMLLDKAASKVETEAAAAKTNE